MTIKSMRRTFVIIAAAMVIGPASASASSSVRLAMELGMVLGSEALCDLTYDQAAIQAFISKNVPEGDMSFPSYLETWTGAAENDIRGMSKSAKTAHCAQIARIAKSYGFTH